MKYKTHPLLKILLGVFVVSLPLVNRDLFSVIHAKLFPARIILVVILSGSAAFALYQIFRSWRSGKIRFLLSSCWKSVKSDRVLWLLLSLWLIRAVSLINSLNISASISLLAYFSAIVGLYLVLKYVWMREPEFLETLYLLHLGMVCLVGFYGLVQIITPFLGVKLPGVLVGGTFFRIPGTFYDANHLPPYLLTAIPSFLIGSWLLKPQWMKKISFVLAGVLSLVLFFTFSRSGIFGFVFSSLFIVFICFRFHYWRKLAFFSVIFSVLALMVILSAKTQYSFVQRALSVLSSQEKSTAAHSLLLYGELDLFLKNPIIGVGYGSFSEHFRNSRIGRYHALVDRATHIRIPAHSLWLESLAETGAIGFLLLVCLIMSLLEGAFHRSVLPNNKRSRLISVAFFSGALGILVGAVYYSYHLEFVWFYLFLAYFFAKKDSFSRFEFLLSSAEEEETIPWAKVLPLASLIIWSGFWLFLDLGGTYLVGEREGFYSLISKNILRGSFVSRQNWWLPSYFGSVIYFQPPLFHWLQALIMFFYYITSFAARFWPAVFGLGILIVLCLWIRNKFGSWWLGVIGSLLLLVLPGFWQASRTASMVSGQTFFLLLFFYFLWLSWGHRFWWLVSGVFFGIFGYFDWRLAGVCIVPWVAVGILTWVRRGFKSWIFWLVGDIISALVFLPWLLLVIRQGQNPLRAYLQSWSELSFSFTWFLPFLVLAAIYMVVHFEERLAFISTKLFKVRKISLFLLFVCSGALLFRYYIKWKFNPNPEEREIKLVFSRHQTSRTGTDLNVITYPVSDVVYFYSDVPFAISDNLEFSLMEKGKIYYAFVPGRRAIELREKLRKSQVGMRVVAVEKDMVLLEKW